MSLPHAFSLFFIMRCTPTVRFLIVTLPPGYRCPLSTSHWPLGSAPAQRAGAQRLCALGVKRTSRFRSRTSEFDPQRPTRAHRASPAKGRL